MPSYNRQFDLRIADVDLIEEALRARGRELGRMRRALSDQNPAHLESIKVLEHDLHEGEELLGRLHDQKIFYRPNANNYVSG
jgi:Ser/Thr protein kinase RdoA (MazF antagonist)